MSLKIGDLVVVQNDEIEVVQASLYPFMSNSKSLTIKIKKGIIFEVVDVYSITKSVRIIPVNHSITDEFIIIVEMDKLYKCGRAVELLYSKKKNNE